MTAGPYFTKQFEELALNYEEFGVVETGWCKLDPLFSVSEETQERKAQLLQTHNAKYIVLYAPTAMPSLSSATALQGIIKKLADHEDIVVLVKFHDKTNLNVMEAYREMEHPSLVFVEESDIIPSMQMVDLLISDTSSVVYEFMLLNKPVITLNSHSENINWSNHAAPQEIYLKVIRTLKGSDTHTRQREKTIAFYHPYRDGNSSARMVEAAENYIKEHGIPEEQPLSPSLVERWKELFKKLFFRS